MSHYIEYHGWGIEVQAYESDGGGWRPKAAVVGYERGSLQGTIVVAPLATTFGTVAEADAYAIEMAKKWIDERAALSSLGFSPSYRS